MAICKYFLRGQCWYGSRCCNEHIDIEQIIKTDIQETIHGNQWLLSCYGPFSGKPCIPDFVKDLSFEEIRAVYYKGNQINDFAKVHQAVNKQFLEAMQKLKALLKFTPDIVKMVVNIYEYNDKSVTSGITKTNQNIFEASNFKTMQNIASVGDSSSVEQSFGSIFKKSYVLNSNSIFSGSQTNSLFSQQNHGMQAQSNNSNYFGQASSVEPQKQFFGAFGQQQQLQYTKSIFEESHGANNIFNSNTPSIFSNQFIQNCEQNQSTNTLFQSEMQQILPPSSEPMLVVEQPQEQSFQYLTDAIIPATQLYTPLQLLTNEELEAFKSDTFTPGNVPTKPPPKDLC
ncbi:nucleoporin NUP42-like [Teleopsis dalmanni]|uniref:nucleoporin NUP42-like n=1 Tax=Teleopsis dalmanni TaxID=139649 RepID=UPI0018CFA158|nr:nucleoporin NUP42-like [Teleopsis dalmanni]